MSEPKPFSVDLGSLKSRNKDSSPKIVEQADRAGEMHGFVSREAAPADASKRGGRSRGHRTKQIHCWVEPSIAEQIADESSRTGKTQGALIEDAWRAFRK